MQPSEERDKALATIRKLAAIANPESGAFPQEIATASAKMQKLMDEFNVSMSEVLFSNPSSSAHSAFDYCQSKALLGRLKAWHWRLARCIGMITQTKHYATSGYGKTTRDPRKNASGHRMTFFGVPQACQVAADLYDEWVMLIDDMAKKEVSNYIQNLTHKYRHEMKVMGVKQVRHLYLGNEHPNIWRDSWLDGLTFGVLQSLEQSQAERSKQTGTALMVMSKAIELAYDDFSQNFQKKVTNRIGNGNASAFGAGKKTGEGIRIGSKRLS